MATRQPLLAALEERDELVCALHADALEFARIRHAISCRESRARIKALEATRIVAPTTRTCAQPTRTCAQPARSGASSTRTVAPKTRTGASEDLPDSQVQNGSGNGIISTMKNGATTLDLLAVKVEKVWALASGMEPVTMKWMVWHAI